ncbi:hypothetical protein, partial [Neobacillus sp.]|uniref:hypothetical protein n=1 Tax=Neobacillus sp. TaxID=2675273 RepID=UPI0028A204D6
LRDREVTGDPAGSKGAEEAPGDLPSESECLERKSTGQLAGQIHYLKKIVEKYTLSRQSGDSIYTESCFYYLSYLYFFVNVMVIATITF